MICDQLNVDSASKAEALGQPINQVAAIVYNGNRVTESEKRLIEDVLPISEIKKSYNRFYSDHIKFNENFNILPITEKPMEYLRLYITMLIKYPVDAIEAGLNLTIGYWYPGVSKGMVSYDVDKKETFLQRVGAKGSPIFFRSQLYDYIIGTGIRDNFALSWLFSIGNFVAFMWILVVMSCIILGWKSIIFFLPNILLWGTMLLAAPSYCETRYVYSIFLCVPIWIGLLFVRNRIKSAYL